MMKTENQKEKDNQPILERGIKPKPSTRKSALLTNPKHRPVLVAKIRDDVNAASQAGFLVATGLVAKEIEGVKLVAITFSIVAPLGDTLGLSDGEITYNEEVIT